MKKASKAKLTEAQILLMKHIREIMPTLVHIASEWKFHPERKWLFDVALPEFKWAFEANGHFQGKHGKGWSSDAEKMNTAQALGWKVFVFTNRQVLTGDAKAWILKHLLGGGK